MRYVLLLPLALLLPALLAPLCPSPALSETRYKTFLHDGTYPIQLTYCPVDEYSPLISNRGYVVWQGEYTLRKSEWGAASVMEAGAPVESERWNLLAMVISPMIALLLWRVRRRPACFTDAG